MTIIEILITIPTAMIVTVIGTRLFRISPKSFLLFAIILIAAALLIGYQNNPLIAGTAAGFLVSAIIISIASIYKYWLKNK